MRGKYTTGAGFLAIILGSINPAPAADSMAPSDTFGQPDAYQLQMQQRLQSMTPEERALYQSMNQLRTENQRQEQARNADKGKGKRKGSRDGSGKKHRYGQNGGQGAGNRMGHMQ
jgi:hypothetical protein